MFLKNRSFEYIDWPYVLKNEKIDKYHIYKLKIGLKMKKLSQKFRLTYSRAMLQP